MLTLALTLTYMHMQAALLDAAARDATEARTRERERRAGPPVLLTADYSTDYRLLTTDD